MKRMLNSLKTSTAKSKEKTTNGDLATSSDNPGVKPSDENETPSEACTTTKNEDKKDEDVNTNRL